MVVNLGERWIKCLKDLLLLISMLFLKAVHRTLQAFKLKSTLPNRFLLIHQIHDIFLLTVHMMDFFIYGFIV